MTFSVTKLCCFVILTTILIFSCVGFSEEGIIQKESTEELSNEQDWSFLLQLAGTGDPFGNITCQKLSDCNLVNGSICVDSLCACSSTKPIFVNVTEASSEGFCLESYNRTQENCSYSQQCNYDHGICSNKVCTCANDFVDNGEGTCTEKKKSATIPIIVGSVIGVAIIGTLGAYCWMSRKNRKNT